MHFTAIQARTSNGAADLVFMQLTPFANSVPFPPDASSGDAPWGLLVDPVFGDLYVADAGETRVVIYQGGMTPTSNGSPATVVLGEPDFSTNSSGIAMNMFSHPSGIALDPFTGALWVADTANHRVQRFTDYVLESERNVSSAPSLDVAISFLGNAPALRMFPRGNPSSPPFATVFSFFLSST